MHPVMRLHSNKRPLHENKSSLPIRQELLHAKHCKTCAWNYILLFTVNQKIINTLAFLFVFHKMNSI